MYLPDIFVQHCLPLHGICFIDILPGKGLFQILFTAQIIPFDSSHPSRSGIPKYKKRHKQVSKKHYPGSYRSSEILVQQSLQPAN